MYIYSFFYVLQNIGIKVLLRRNQDNPSLFDCLQSQQTEYLSNYIIPSYKAMVNDSIYNSFIVL